MREIALFLLLVFIFGFGYFVMRKLDGFFTAHYRQDEDRLIGSTFEMKQEKGDGWVMSTRTAPAKENRKKGKGMV